MTIDLLNLTDRQISENASDLHLVSGMAPLLRLANSMLVTIPETTIVSSDAILATADQWAGAAAGQKLRTEKFLETCIDLPDRGRFRATFFYEKNGPAAVLRFIPDKIATPDELGIHASILKKLDNLRGLILITGSNGSGKSTTLSSLIQYINLNQRVNIITLEDPIEQIFTSDKAIISQCELGQHFDSFAGATKLMIRRDIDIVVIGELRDSETMAAALSLAESGPLVIATMHTRNSTETVQRVIDFFPTGHQAEVAAQLAITLNMVLSQKLIPTKDGRSRVCVRERMFVNDAIKYSIRERNLGEIHSALQIGGDDNMQLFDNNLLTFVQSGQVSPIQAVLSANDTQQMRNALIEMGYTI